MKSILAEYDAWKVAGYAKSKRQASKDLRVWALRNKKLKGKIPIENSIRNALSRPR